MQERPKFSVPYEKKVESISVEDRERVTKQVESFSRLPEVATNIAQLPYFLRRYQEEGENLDSLYREAETRSVAVIDRKKEEMHDGFMKSKEHGEFAQFIELLPLLANKEGRLGKYISAKVTKTAKPDDAGASFVDVVVELRNNYLKTEEAQKDRFLRTVRPTTSFALDLTSNPGAFEKKVSDFQRYELQGKGNKAHVFAYEQKFPGGIAKLGIDTLKGVVLRDEKELAGLVKRLRSALSPSSQGGFIITDERYFDKVFREFFLAFVISIKESASNSVVFLDSLPGLTPQQKDLKISYQALINFLEAYEKTPSN